MTRNRNSDPPNEEQTKPGDTLPGWLVEKVLVPHSVALTAGVVALIVGGLVGVLGDNKSDASPSASTPATPSPHIPDADQTPASGLAGNRVRSSPVQRGNRKVGPALSQDPRGPGRHEDVSQTSRESPIAVGLSETPRDDSSESAFSSATSTPTVTAALSAPGNPDKVQERSLKKPTREDVEAAKEAVLRILSARRKTTFHTPAEVTVDLEEGRIMQERKLNLWSWSAPLQALDPDLVVAGADPQANGGSVTVKAWCKGPQRDPYQNKCAYWGRGKQDAPSFSSIDFKVYKSRGSGFYTEAYRDADSEHEFIEALKTLIRYYQ